MANEIDFLQLRTGRRLALLSLACAALSASAFVIGASFFWGRPTLFAYEHVMETGALLMAVSAVLGVAGFIRAGDGGVRRPMLVKFVFGSALIFLALLIAGLISALGMPPLT